MRDLDTAGARKQIVEFIRQRTPAGGVVVGLSGGIDSSLVLALCVEAVGKGKTLGIFMPESASGVPATIKLYAESLGIRHETIAIKPIFDAYARHGGISDEKLVAGNLKARIRMNLLYSRSNARGLVVIGTGNKSELLTGYFTKYGDGGVDYLPIGDLYKTHVRQLAEHAGVPDPIITQPPSAGLWEGQTDEKELGITYRKLDRILHEHYDNGTPFDQVDLPGITEADVKKVKRLTEAAAPKLTMPPVCRVRK
ncbi:MAG TPA: NAD+ synthase [Candidatus Saccharimonadales bacterium]|nr:NAD+ synthase [Candidatus Saccharimonadales bacterium]